MQSVDLSIRLNFNNWKKKLEEKYRKRKNGKIPYIQKRVSQIVKENATWQALDTLNDGHRMSCNEMTSVPCNDEWIFKAKLLR